MDLMEFEEQNEIIAGDQKPYKPIPAHRFAGDPRGRIAFCWRLSWRERFAVFFRGVIWHEVLTFEDPLMPQKLSVNKPAMGPAEDLIFCEECGGILKSGEQVFNAHNQGCQAPDWPIQTGRVFN